MPDPLLAGHETTATALTWTWYLLCQHPERYQKVQQEVDSVLQGRTPTYADLAHLPYCLQVFKEAMRLYPPAYVMSRQALHDVEIDGYRVPKTGSSCFLRTRLHRREECFPEPEQFDPERFTPEREKQLPRYVYLPFGAGPRICLGMYFAHDGGPSVAGHPRPAHQFCPGSWSDHRTRSRPSPDITACRVDQCHGEEEVIPASGTLHRGSMERESGRRGSGVRERGTDSSPSRSAA